VLHTGSADRRPTERRCRDVGELGELWVKGPNVTPGYWNRPEANASSFTDGWLHTGDATRVDEEGFYYIVDRWKDMYISGGENVYPAEVENVLHQITAIAEAAVIGIPTSNGARSAWRRRQRLVEIGDDVVDVLDADRQAHIARRHAGLQLLLGRQLRMRRAGRMDGEAARVADVGDVIEHLERVDEARPASMPPFSSKPTSPPCRPFR
jgi:acyl-CoA synthetase (AMP-forming)/AMP-acid ligase II